MAAQFIEFAFSNAGGPRRLITFKLVRHAEEEPRVLAGEVRVEGGGGQVCRAGRREASVQARLISSGVASVRGKLRIW